MSQLTVLIVEDDGIISLHLQDLLRSWGYRVLSAMSGEEALDLAMANPLDLVLMDIRLSGPMDGISTALKLRGCCNVPVIFLTAYADRMLTERAKEVEPYGYLIKPIQERELRSSIEIALAKFNADQRVRESERRFRAMFEQAGIGVTLTDSHTGQFIKVNQKFSSMVGFSSEELEGGITSEEITYPDDLPATLMNLDQLRKGEVREFTLEKRYVCKDQSLIWILLTASALWEPGKTPTQHIAFSQDITARKQAEVAQQRSYDETIEGWSRAMDLRDKETERHTQRVKDLSLALARLAGLPESELVHIRRGALLHDIGKLGVPDEILTKPGRLTDEEWVSMRKHPRLAYDLLQSIEYLRPALAIPYCHHEKWDGSGYPCQLKGEEIPLAARLFTIVDVWDAITNDRPYSKAWPLEEARAYIQNQSGSHFDPRVVAWFLQLLDQS